jgi:hypothetical protein
MTLASFKVYGAANYMNLFLILKSFHENCPLYRGSHAGYITVLKQ